jgi:hypothetical protein
LTENDKVENEKAERKKVRKLKETNSQREIKSMATQ